MDFSIFSFFSARLAWIWSLRFFIVDRDLGPNLIHLFLKLFQDTEYGQGEIGPLPFLDDRGAVKIIPLPNPLRIG
jgi:hypothetical protein